jgi:carboxypeptidase C (cathepsin A)
MLPRTLRFALLVMLIPILPAALNARQDPPKDAPKDAPKAAEETLTKTDHFVTVDGKKIEYQATAGTLTLHDDDGKATAHVFFVAYNKTVAGNNASRPITFAFNGGPGSSAVWLHLGAFGPKRVDLGENGRETAPPYHLVDNDGTLLDLSDLVFIDPVSTGFSRAVKPEDAKNFHGTEADLHSMAVFIRQYLTKFNRWDSPKYLAGESYGTTRAAGLSNVLEDEQGIYLNGIVFVSVVFNFQTIAFNEGNDLPYPLFLPTYTATAWVHKRLPSELQSDLGRTLAEVEQFSVGEYTTGLMRDGELSPEEREALARKVARYTGLTPEYVLRSGLRIEASRFRKELLREKGRTVGRYDSRYQGTDLDDVSDRPEYDPSYPVVQAPFTALVNNYFRATLNYHTDLDYRVLTGKVQPWDYGAKNHYLNTGPSLRQAMAKNPGLRVFVASGRYDLATPYAATRYTFSHLGLNPDQRKRVTLENYPAGHMMYTEKESRQKLKADLMKFYQSAEPAGGTQP